MKRHGQRPSGAKEGRKRRHQKTPFQIRIKLALITLWLGTVGIPNVLPFPAMTLSVPQPNFFLIYSLYFHSFLIINGQLKEDGATHAPTLLWPTYKICAFSSFTRVCLLATLKALIFIQRSTYPLFPLPSSLFSRRYSLASLSHQGPKPLRSKK